jgi:hypothetical protein
MAPSKVLNSAGTDTKNIKVDEMSDKELKRMIFFKAQ